jgi:hypothetical protein
MALQVSGPIDAAGIRTEFGATNGTSVRFSAYRVSQTISGLTDMPLDAGIPQSGPIKFSDFYSKKLNVVVDYTPVGVGTTTRVTARTDYDANNSKIVVIGNFRQRPVSPAGTKVWIHTNGTVGSDTNAPNISTSSQLAASVSFTTTRDSSSPNYIYLTPPPASGYPTLTFGPDSADYVSTVYTNVEYTITGNSGLKFRLNGSTQIQTDDSGTGGDYDWNDLTLNLGIGSFYTVGGVFYYKFETTQTSNEKTRIYSSLITGAWTSTTDLILNIGSSGKVVGAGGFGGKGGDGGSNGVGSRRNVFDTAGANGGNGTSAIGINHYPITITNNGTIQAGGGGGAGGGGAYGLNRNTGRNDDTYGAGGGGGGGGIGYPGGAGGLGGTASGSTANAQGNVGNPGTITSSGKGGDGSNTGWALGGGGGGGSTSGLGGAATTDTGGTNQSSGAGTNGTTSIGGNGGRGWRSSRFDGPNEAGSGGGTGGSSGYAIVNGTGFTLSIAGIGTVIGTVSPINTPPV